MFHIDHRSRVSSTRGFFCTFFTNSSNYIYIYTNLFLIILYSFSKGINVGLLFYLQHMSMKSYILEMLKMYGIYKMYHYIKIVMILKQISIHD